MNRCGKTRNSVKKSESRRPAKLSRPQRVSVTGEGADLSDGEAVISMFFLIRYQSVVAIRTHVNFTRQFSRVSLVNRTEGNFARQFFKSSLFIIAVQQNFCNALTKRLQSEIGVNSPPIANENAACHFRRQLRHGVEPTASAMTTKRTAELGISKNGKTCVVSCVRNHATTPYATAAG
jgi:hypothetical protein